MRKPVHKRKSLWILIFLAAFSFLAFIRDPLLAVGSKVYLSRVAGKQGWSIESITVEREHTFLKGIKAESSLGVIEIKEAEILWHLSLSPFCLEPKVEVIEPIVTLKKGEEDSSSLGALLFKNPRFAPKVSVKKGELYFAGEEQGFAFDLSSGDGEGELGTLHVFTKEREEELFKVNVRKDKELFAAELAIFRAEIASLRPLAARAGGLSLDTWSSFEGEISAVVNCSFSLEGKVLGAEAGLELQGLNLQNQQLDFALQSKALKATALFRPEEKTPLWKQLDMFLTFEDSTFLTTKNGSTFGFEESLGELRLHPDSDPYLKTFGSVISKGVRVYFEVEGKGALLEHGAYWLETEADFFLGDKVSKIALSLCQNEREESTLQVECAHITKEVANLLQLAFPIYEMEAGELSGKLLGRFAEEGVKSLDFSNCKAKGLALHFPKELFHVHVGDLSFSGAFEQNTLGKLDLNSSDMEVRRASIAFKEWKIEDITSSLKVAHGEFASSYLEGSYSGMKATLQLLPKEAKNLLHLECGGYLNDFFSFREKGKLGEKPVTLAMDLQAEEGYASFSGIARVMGNGEEDIEFEGRLDKKVSRRFKDLTSSWDLSSARGSFFAEKLSARALAPYIGEALTGVEGGCRAQGSFNSKGVELALTDADVNFSDKGFLLSCQINEKEPARIYYETSSSTWEGTIPLSRVFIEEEKVPLPIEVTECTFVLKEGAIIADGWKAQIGAISTGGMFSLKDNSIVIETDFIEGELSSLAPIFPDVDFSYLQGEFKSKKRGGRALGTKALDGWQWKWSVVTDLEDLSCSFGKGGFLEKGRATLTVNSDGALSLQQGEGTYSLSSFVSQITLKDFFWDRDKEADFGITLEDKGGEVLSIAGHLRKKEKGYAVAVDPSTHILGAPVKVTLLSFDEGWKLHPVAGEISLQLKALPSFLSVGKRMGFSLKEITDLDGEVKVKGFYNPVSSSLDLFCYSPAVSYKGDFLGEVNGKVEKRGRQLEITSQVGSYVLQGSLEAKEKEWKISSFVMESQEGGFFAEGVYEPSSSRLSIPSFVASFSKEEGKMSSKGSFEGSFSCKQGFFGRGTSEVTLEVSEGVLIKSERDVEFSFASNHGIEIEKSEWEATKKEIPLAKVSLAKAHALLGEEKIVLEGGSLKVAEAALEGIPLELSKEIGVKFEGTLSASHRKFKGSIDNRECSFHGIPLEMKNIQFLLENEDLFASCQTSLGGEGCFLQAQTNFGKSPFVTILLKEQLDKTGLALQIKQSKEKKWQLEGVTGAFKGVELEVQKEEGIYELLMQVDFMQARPLFPKKLKEQLEKASVGRGYSCHANFVLAEDSLEIKSLNGEVKGAEFQLLGKVMRSLKGRVFYDGKKLTLQNLMIEDDSGVLATKLLEVHKKEGELLISAPLTHVKEFSPSLLIQGKKEGPVIKNLSVYNLKGNLLDIESLEGTGALNFTSSEQKEFSLWDVPAGIVKDLGLAPGLLTPVVGEVDFSLSKGKVLFTALRNTFSEGRRSQFDLSSQEGASYLTLDGDLCVDLKMKQSALLKVAEGFVLSIRGTVEKPKYSFKLKEAI